MDVERLRGVLAAAGRPPTPRELAEVLWLAGHLPGGPDTPPAAGPDPPVALPARTPEGAAPSGPRPPAEPEPAQPEQPDRLPLHVPDAPAGAGDDDLLPAAPVRAPTDPVLPDRLAVLRALRPLKRSAPATRSREMDEQATIDWYAERRRWLPVLRPVTERALDLAVVVDRGPAGALWDGLVGEVLALCRQLGAFRDIRLRYLTVDRAGRPGLAVRPGDAPGRSRGPAELTDPSGRRLVLLLSDCVGAVWQTPAATRMLAGWARHGPVAILQPLPEQLWSRTSLPPVAGVLRGTGFGRANSLLSFTAHHRDRRSASSTTVPVPVLEISPGWLAPWARLVAGAAEAGVDAMVALVGADEVGPVAGAPPADLTPFDRVLRFRAEATAEAYRLAGYLAVAPLTPSVMRVVQAAMMPRSGPAHLAEVWFSGLLRPVRGGGPEPLYDFVDGVRDVLLGTLRRHELVQVGEEVSRFVEPGPQRAGRSFTAAVPAPDGPLRLSPLSRPFARIRAQALARLHPPAPAPPSAEAAAVVATPDTADSPSSWLPGGPPTGLARLRELLTSGPHDRMVVVTSGPGGDALRAALVEVRTCLPGWTLVTGLPEQVPDGQPSVLLLTDAATLFLGPDSAELAARTRELLARDDVLVLAVMRPARLAIARHGQRGLSPQARQLFRDAVDTRIPGRAPFVPRRTPDAVAPQRGGNRLASARSRVLLIGTSGISDRSAVYELNQLWTALTGIPGLPAEHVVLLADSDPVNLLEIVHEFAAEADDTLLVCYAGPSSEDRNGELLLSPDGYQLADQPDALRYRELAELLTAGRAAPILAIDTPDAERAWLGDVPAGLNLITARRPVLPGRERGTAALLTELADLLQWPDPEAGPDLTLRSVVRQLGRHAHIRHRIWQPDIVLTPNPAYSAPEAHPAPEKPEEPLPSSAPAPRSGQAEPVPLWTQPEPTTPRPVEGPGSSPVTVSPAGESRVTSVKLVVAGGFGTGKTTFVGALSEITPVATERMMTAAGAGVDDLSGTPDKTTLTVALDAGRVTLAEDLVVYLTGVPGTTRFWFAWDSLVLGAVGAVVLVDTRRLADSFAAIDFVEQRDLPFVVALNVFDPRTGHEIEEVRQALALAPEVPVLWCDARSRESGKTVIVTLLEHALEVLSSRRQRQGTPARR